MQQKNINTGGSRELQTCNVIFHYFILHLRRHLISDAGLIVILVVCYVIWTYTIFFISCLY